MSTTVCGNGLPGVTTGLRWRKARAVMAGVDDATLRTDDLVRQRIAEEMLKLKAALDPLIVDVGTRQITLEGDDDELV